MNKIHLLLVEDNEGDIILTKEALENSSFIGKIDIARDGKVAIDFFEKILIKNELSLPDIVFLDINLPKINGQEVLQYIKGHQQLKHIPVIVFTTSSSNNDIIESYQNHANCFVTKPVEVDQFMDVVSKIEQFWFDAIQIIPQKK